MSDNGRLYIRTVERANCAKIQIGWYFTNEFNEVVRTPLACVDTESEAVYHLRELRQVYGELKVNDERQ